MSAPLDELYFTWLYSQVGSVKLKNPSRTYWTLARQLFSKEFVWLVPNDDNRVEDGRDLRHIFATQEQLDDIDPEWMNLGCSMLELLIGLSRRLSFEDDREPREWFWELIDNLGLKSYNDRTPGLQGEVDEVLDRVIWRQYEPDGSGGLFPLRYAKTDQRNEELWYQLNAYLLERD